MHTLLSLALLLAPVPLIEDDDVAPGSAPGPSDEAPSVEDEAAEWNTERAKARQGQRISDAALKDLQIRKQRVFVGLFIPSMGFLGLSGLTFLLARKGMSSDTGPNCTTGIRCGNTCIAVGEKCTVGSGGGGLGGRVTPLGWVLGTSFFLAGVGFLVASIVAPRRLQAREPMCSIDGCSFRF